MGGAHILVVDDEEDILELIGFNLARAGFEVTCVDSGEKALATARSTRPSLIVLDLMMPRVDGFEVCRRLRERDDTRHVPIIILTARDEDDDIVRGLEHGADDYVTKPFSPKVLIARIEAVLRRAGREVPPEDQILEIRGIRIHPGRHEVSIGDRQLHLTGAEFRALHFLARRPGWVFTRQQIVDAVHGEEYVVTHRSVDVMMVGLRRKLGRRGSILETVRGVGYRLKG
jgi:two-component system phosphate regulon response regulator PhoB